MPYVFEIMNKLLFIIFCCCWVSLGGFQLSTAVAKNKAEIVAVEIAQDPENLKVSFYIQDCFTPSMEEAIQSGVPTTFRILAVLEKPGVLFFDTEILNVVLEHTIKYDYLKNEYVVQLPENPDSTLITKNFLEAKRWMSTVKDLPLLPLWRLQKDEVYQLRLKAELSKVELPLFFRYIFFFVSLWDFETDWQKINLSL
jgi:hypothetical protein